MKLQLVKVETSIGRIRAVVGPRGICDLDFEERWDSKLARLVHRFGCVNLEAVADAEGVADALGAYFEGRLNALDDLPVDPGGTPFQRSVWTALRRIPCGRTTTYGALASAIGLPGGARPVGQANARNPVAIVIPCHRVVGSTGRLTGYACGLPRKRWLLAHERAPAVAIREQPDLFIPGPHGVQFPVQSPNRIAVKP